MSVDRPTCLYELLSEISKIFSRSNRLQEVLSSFVQRSQQHRLSQYCLLVSGGRTTPQIYCKTTLKFGIRLLQGFTSKSFQTKLGKAFISAAGFQHINSSLHKLLTNYSLKYTVHAQEDGHNKVDSRADIAALSIGRYRYGSDTISA